MVQPQFLLLPYISIVLALSPQKPNQTHGGKSLIDDAIRMIVLAGRGALIGKVDIKSAYRIVPMHPSDKPDKHLLGMQWRGKFYVDLALPFGLRSVPLYF